VTDDDIWVVSTQGGISRRLTSIKGQCSSLLISPDGRTLAFVANENGGNACTYIMPSQGGEIKQLTYAGSARPVYWLNNLELVISSDHESHLMRDAKLYRLNLQTGLMQDMELGEASHVAFGKNGAVVLARNGSDLARWKRYRGGTAGHLWYKANKSTPFRRYFEELKTNITDPFIVGNTLYLLSDHEGVGNVYTCELGEDSLSQVTQSKEYFVRHLHTDGKMLVYQRAGEIFTYDLSSNKEAKVEIEVQATFNQAQAKYVDAKDYLNSGFLGAGSSRLGIITRGQLFTTHLKGAPFMHHENSDHRRYQMAQTSSDGKTIYAVETQLAQDTISFGLWDESKMLPLLKNKLAN